MVAILRIPALVVLLLLFAVRASAQHTNATAITITDCPNPCPASGQPASLYPSTITVSGEVGVVQRVSVTLNGLSHAFPADVDFLLVSPSGRKSVIMSDFGAGSPGVSNLTLTLDDYAERPVPSTVTGNTGVPFVTGTYRPANSGTTDIFPAPAPAAPFTYTLSAFNGDSPNGTWSLYIIDDANLDAGSISGGWIITFDVRPPPPAAGDILISEFRTRGAGTTPPGSDGSADEFIELYNNTDSSITIIDSVPGADPTSGSGAGWRIAGAQAAAETTFLVLPQTLSTAGPIALAPRSYFLITSQPSTPSPAGNTYSLSTYPTGTGITASGSANVSVNPASATVGFLPDDVGLAIFSTAGAVSAARLDSVGFSSVTHADYKEGTGLAPAGGIVTPSQHSWTRRLSAGVPQDTGDNAADFLLVSTTGDVIDGQAATLGAPGPERGQTMTAFTTTGAPSHYPPGAMTSARIDPAQAEDAAPNLVRDLTPVTNGSSGTLKIRRRYTNTTGDALVAMRFRVAALSTRTGGAALAGQADLRVLNSPTQTITLTDTSTVTSQALTVQTPAAQALGGGVNSSLTAGVITTTAPLANGASVVVEFNLGVETDGPYQIVIRGEGLAADGIGGVNVLDVFSTRADLAITKTDGVTTATPGGSVTYTITASNAGPSNATGATVADTFPASLTCTWTCVGAGGGTCTAAGAGNINNSVNLPAGGSVTYTASCTIAPGATGTLVNTAAVSTPAGVTDPNPANNSATDADTLAAQANLAITKTDGVATATPGGSVTYTITASNAGPSNATGATVADTFPASLTCTWTCVGAGGGTCTAAGAGNINNSVNLPAGGSVTYTASCTVAPGATGTLVNTATVSAPAGVTDPSPANNSATDSDTLVTSADLAISKSAAPDPVVAGQNLTYTITVTNSGPSAAASILLSDPLPAAVTFVSLAAPGGWSCTTPPVGSGGAISCSIVSLGAAGSGVFTLTTTTAPATPPGTVVTNTATVSSPTPDPTPGNNSATASTHVDGGGPRCDVNGDGNPEFITTAGPGGGPHLRVWSVAGGSVTELAGSGFFVDDPAFPGGVYVTCRDLTGDAIDELITAKGPGGTPDVRIWSLQGNTLVEVTRFFAYDPAFRGGVTVAVGDVTGDGVKELITGAGPGGGPHVRVWTVTGGSVSELGGFFAYDPAFPGGVSVTVGDITGDGVSELITGAGPGGGPHVRVWSVMGGSLSELGGFFAYNPAFPGGVSVAVGDVTGDGVGDLITGAGPGGGPHVRVWSLVGSSLVEVAGFFAYAPAFQGGVFVAAGDVTGDGIAELITGAGPGGGPHVRVWSLTPAGFVEVAGFFAYAPAFPGGVRVGR